MSDHQPMPVAGYTPQSDDKVRLANEGKELEERYMRWLDKLALRNDLYEPRCVAEARTCIQTGAMWAVRSIFQPQRIKLPEDAQ